MTVEIIFIRTELHYLRVGYRVRGMVNHFEESLVFNITATPLRILSVISGGLYYE